MTTKQLHFKWTISRGRDTYGYNICTLLVDGEKAGRCMGGGYDMQGTSFAQWLEHAYQEELIKFNNDNGINERPPVNTYESKDGIIRKYALPGYYGMSVIVKPNGKSEVHLDGACGMRSIEQIAEAIGIKLQWNPESGKYKNHTYYTAIINN